jgi:hypothetical protein
MWSPFIWKKKVVVPGTQGIHPVLGRLGHRSELIEDIPEPRHRGGGLGMWDKIIGV